MEGNTWNPDVPEISESSAVMSGDMPPTPPPVERLVEAILFVGSSPLTAERAAAVIRGISSEQLRDTIEALNHEYREQGRPYHIQSQDRGYVLSLRPRFKPVVVRLYGKAREARLSAPAIDVLSLVAYRQPVTKQEIDGIRGSESGSLLRQLVRRNLIAVVQRAEAGRREVLYGTTQRFLEIFKLSRLDDLPQTQDLQKL
jgi:segregation and condensation protein B